MDLSIIIPVYNVEKYIRPCMESIFKQGLDDSCFEVIIVNDGSTDKSIETITDIIRQHKNITIINQENLSLSVARNNGIAIAKGEYIIMPDSDDLLIEDSLPILLKKALETKADLVVADFLTAFDEEIDHIKTKNPPVEEFQMKIKSGRELYLEDLNPFYCYVWRTLYRRAFLLENKITFIPNINYQDIPYTHECYLKADRCIKASWLLNIYRKGRDGAATHSFSQLKARSFTIALANTWKLKEKERLSPEVMYKFEDNIYTLFRLMLFRTIHSIKKKSERNQIIDNLMIAIPNLRFSHNFTQRLITFMIRKAPHLFINLYYRYFQMTHYYHKSQKYGKN